jgi:Putative Actinobacterial Holin-X, holin superfamily III
MPSKSYEDRGSRSDLPPNTDVEAARHLDRAAGDLAVNEAPAAPREEAPPSISTALHHVLDASHRVVVSRMDLIRLEAREDLTHVVSAATLIIIGGVFFVGLVALLEALLVQALHQRFSVMTSIGIAAVIHIAIGGSILATGIRWMHRIKFMKPDDAPTYSGNALFPHLRAAESIDEKQH